MTPTLSPLARLTGMIALLPITLSEFGIDYEHIAQLGGLRLEHNGATVFERFLAKPRLPQLR